jgi:putative tricarboxylic transport membrane protein
MHAARRATGIAVILLGLFLAWQGTRLRIHGDFGPGPGLFPFWIGCALAALGVAWSAQGALARAGSEASRAPFLPPPGARLTIAIVIAALLGFMLLLRPLGFDLAMLALLLTLFFAIDRSHPRAKILLALLGSFGVHRVFETVLAVPLPGAALPALRQLGL